MVTYGMISAICQVYIKRGSDNGGGNSVERNKEKKEKKEIKRRKKRKKEREERKEREREGEARERRRGKGRKIGSFFLCRRSDGRSSLGQELKSVYMTRATLQELGILPPLVISTLRAIWPCFLP